MWRPDCAPQAPWLAVPSTPHSHPHSFMSAGEISACGLGSSGGSIDAAQASSIRAACRRNQLLAGFEAGLELGEGAEEGEEDCEPEEM